MATPFPHHPAGEGGGGGRGGCGWHLLDVAPPKMRPEAAWVVPTQLKSQQFMPLPSGLPVAVVTQAVQSVCVLQAAQQPLALSVSFTTRPLGAEPARS